VKIPLTYTDIVDEIVTFTSLPREEVEHKVWMQALQPGWNVLQDVARFCVTPHVSNNEMDLLYEQGDGFIFETLVYWAKPERYRCTEHALERINLYATQNNISADNITILIFGDGTGNDSLYLAKQGFRVDYFDVPRSKTFQFAMKRFDKYGFLGNSIRPLPNYPACFNHAYDVVISFDVLEHLPEPLETIKDISSTLKTGGIALITEDFGDIIARLPTHLRINTQYLGKSPYLFLKNKMRLSWYSQETLFKPMEFVKVNKVSARDWFSLVRDLNVRSAYIRPYYRNIARLIAKLAYFGG
jgi:SAM-dependent methyltransferase